MANNLELIANVSIDIQSPIVDATSFDNLLIIGPAPADTGHTAPKVGVYSSLGEVTDTGYVAIGDDADIVGVAARIAFSQSPAPSCIYIATVEEDDNVTDVLATAVDYGGWYAICPVGLTTAQITSIIEWTETQEKICVYTEASATPTQKTLYYRSGGIFCAENTAQNVSDIPAANLCINVAWVVKCLNFHSGRETWAFKQLTGISPSSLSSAEMKALDDGNVSYFVTSAGKNITLGGKVLAGEWLDVIRFRDWLKNDMQVRVANLFVLNPKIPYTDQGIGLIENQMIASLKSGITYDGIAPEEYDEDGASIPSYTTSVPLASSLTSSQKASRKLTDCTFSARLAGAIHLAEIKGSLTYTL